MTHNLSILGSTGSIGTQSLKVAENLGIQISAICADTNINLIEEQIRKYKPKMAALRNEKLAAELKTRVSDTNTIIYAGEEGIIRCATENDADTVLNSLVGIAGLLPTLSAIDAKKTIALANKETLVTAGDIVMKKAKENNVCIYPVDSEHSAVFQCLQSVKKNEISKIILTASGGPFFGYSSEELENVSVEDALNHPNWSMGKKITVDCATMMNKGFEVIEAMHLFDVSVDDIEVVIHRESIIHSLVETKDGAVLAELGVPDMSLPIQYALTYPDRMPTNNNRLSLAECGKLTFYSPDLNFYKCLDICLESAKKGGIMPCVVNGANEVCVDAFLKGKIMFTDIAEIVKKVVNNTENKKEVSLEDILFADKYSRKEAEKYIV